MKPKNPIRYSSVQSKVSLIVFLITSLLFVGCGVETTTTMPMPTPSIAPASPTTEEKAPVAEAVTLTSFYTVDHYDTERNAEADLKMTLTRAAQEKKRVLIQVGGDWCGWCKRLTKFIDENDEVRSAVEKNYLVMKVTYTSEHKNEPFLSQYPAIKGYPHLFVLDSNGKLLHSQDTGALEEGSSYNKSVLLEFFERWKSPSE